jgi:hypothetical protein
LIIISTGEKVPVVINHETLEIGPQPEEAQPAPRTEMIRLAPLVKCARLQCAFYF